VTSFAAAASFSCELLEDDGVDLTVECIVSSCLVAMVDSIGGQQVVLWSRVEDSVSLSLMASIPTKKYCRVSFSKQ
jgi:hypothetical protein